MTGKQMTSLERTMAAINHQEPDRVPLFLLFSFYGAKEMHMVPKEYFSKPDHVVHAQLSMREKYRHDCIYTFFYAPIEIEAWGGEVVFTDDGPPNTGEPLLKSLEDIRKLDVPEVRNSPPLNRVLEVTGRLKDRLGDQAPIIGVVMSPFSLPVMQLGFEKYLELIYNHRDLFHLLMQKNAAFCAAWANAQLEAGATAICYFNPLASPNMIEKKTYLATGYPVDRSTLGGIRGATATHLASGISLPVLDEIVGTGTAVLGFSSEDNPVEIKKASKNRICLLGNLSGLEMIHWDAETTGTTVRNLIDSVGQGGGFLLSDSHGEITWQVPEEVLLEIAEAVECYGRYPLKRVD